MRLPEPIHYVESRANFNDHGYWVSSGCRFCQDWFVGLLTDVPPSSNGVVNDTQRGLQLLCNEALAEHQVDCAPDLADPADVERWLAG